MTLFKTTDHMTTNEGHAGIENTHLGQASTAGGGPAGKTCRQCRYWYNNWIIEGERSAVHRYRGATVEDGWLYLEPSRCWYPIAGKARRRVPHDAEACSKFLAQKNPPPPKRKRVKRKQGTGRGS